MVTGVCAPLMAGGCAQARQRVLVPRAARMVGRTCDGGAPKSASGLLCRTPYEGRSGREQLRCEVSKDRLAREHHSPQEHTLDVLKPPQLTRGGSGNMLIYMCTLLRKVDLKWSFWRLGDQDELFVSNKCTSRYAQLTSRSATARFGRSPNFFFQPPLPPGSGLHIG